MRTLLLQQLRDRRASMVGWTLGWLTLVGMYVATWPTIKTHGRQYDDILRGLPSALRSVLGSQSGGAFSTPAGYFTAELLAITGPLVAITMGVLLGAGLLARDEEDGSLELLLAQPVSRTTVLLSRVTVAGAELVGVLALAGLALFASGLLVDLHVGVTTCLPATAMLALLGVQAMTLALLVGAVSGRSTPARAVAGAAGLVAFLLNALGPSISWLSGVVPVSPFHTLMASDPFRRMPPGTSVLTLVAPAAAFAAAAVVLFRRRDLRLR
ncbi:MAG: ABC transporter permease [Actinomycetota bacterium]|nr:ABC transporter permease [Actinomycetota bacterium]